MIEFLIKIVGLLIYVFCEILFCLGAWLIGVVVLTLFTLGKAEVGHFRNIDFFSRDKSIDKLPWGEMKALRTEQYLANRTMLFGTGVIFLPILCLLIYIITHL